MSDEQYARQESNTPSKTTGKPGIPTSGGANSDANLTKPVLPDPDLAQVVAAWPDLSKQIRRAIMSLIEALETENENL